MKEVVIWNEAHTNCFGETELKDGVTEEIGYGLSARFVVLQDRRSREPDPLLERFWGSCKEPRTAKVVNLVGDQQAHDSGRRNRFKYRCESVAQEIVVSHHRNLDGTDAAF